MKWNMHFKIVKKFASGLVMLSTIVFMCNNVLAASTVAPQKNVEAAKKPVPTIGQKARHKDPRPTPQHIFQLRKEKDGWRIGEGWLLTSTGGLSYINPNNADYWFKLSGVLRIDETIFMGDTTTNKNDFPSGALLRTADLYLDGGIGRDWEYTISLEFARRASTQFGIGDTHIAYSGFMDNNQVFVGRVPGNWFGLDNSNSTSWMAFLYRSMPSLAFYPGDGLGLMTDFWSDWGAVTLTAMQPDQGDFDDIVPTKRDRWHGTIRATVAPVHEEGDVWHFGVSGAYRELVSSEETEIPVGAQFRAFPSARARNTPYLLDTTTGNQTPGSIGLPIQANNLRLFNVEAARQYGPFMLEGEYTNAYVHTVNNPYGSLSFSGWMVQSRYLLTGESHAYDVRDGQFGSVTPNHTWGALEVAARYDFLNLNDKFVRGGTEHDVTVGFNWFINQQLRLSANYIHASIHPANDKPRRDVDIIGMRAQVRFK